MTEKSPSREGRPSPLPLAPSDARSVEASAIWFPAARTVEIRTETFSGPRPDEVRVRALDSAISHGTEMLVYRGAVPPGLNLDLPTLQGSFHFPVKYGYASVGRVVDAGASVRNVNVDDVVFVLHPHQTEYVVPAHLALPLPRELSPEIGVFTASLETAINIVLDAHPWLGERLVIFGQGVIGLLVTQLARQAGISKIIVVDPIDRRRELARQLGADLALGPDDDVVDAVRQMTDGVGSDLAIELSGDPRGLNRAIEVVAFQGTIVVASWYGTKPVTLQLGSAFHRGRLRLVSSQVGSLDPSLQPRWGIPRRLSLVRDLLSRLQLDALITHRIPFADAARAYRLVDQHPDEVIQVILTYEG